MSSFDITQALMPKSDQMDAVDLLGGPPQVFTITSVSEGNAEQPVQIGLAEFPRVWRPSKGMLRVLAHCWGKVTAEWVGRRVELYCDPDVMFGPDRVGGVRISRLSNIEKRTPVPMIIKRGKGGSWNVDPLPDAPAATKPTSPVASSPELLAELTAMFDRKGIPEDSRLSGANHITGGNATTIEAIAEDDARKVLAALEKRPDADPALVEDNFSDGAK